MTFFYAGVPIIPAKLLNRRTYRLLRFPRKWKEIELKKIERFLAIFGTK